MTTEKRIKKTIYDLYEEILQHQPDIADQLDVALLRATEHNMNVRISLRTCSAIDDEMELKVFKHTGRYFDCSIYPISNMMKMPQKPKTYVPKGETESKTYVPKPVLDGTHLYAVTDLVDTYNLDREHAAAHRIDKMKFIKDKLGDGKTPMLYELMIKLLKRIVATLEEYASKKEELDRRRQKVSELFKRSNPGASLDEIKWEEMNLTQLEGRSDDKPEDKQCRLFPSWYVQTMKNEKYQPVIECNLNLYCTEGVYESIACGIVFYEMLRYFNLDKYLIRNPESLFGSINIFTENSGFKRGQAIWNEKRNQYVIKQREQAEKNRLQMEQDANCEMQDANFETQDATMMDSTIMTDC